MERSAHITRRTRETDISLMLSLDGTGESRVETDIGFFDHMLNSFAKHGLFDLELKAKGDLEVDCHHTIEDVGICLGEAIREALGDKYGICRFGDIILPMDDALVLVALDLGG
ncbi:MAG: imidazoleglycerol-phosphate dehydratase, partial [Lachnospiraceae bacterium]|nr:imidazoleglycerol-phosphate dehydratase [Lachnospiraceae bacterium]